MKRIDNVYKIINNPTKFQIDIVRVTRGHTSAETIHAFEVIKLAILTVDIEKG